MTTRFVSAERNYRCSALFWTMQSQVEILGVPVSVVGMRSAADEIGRWIEAGEARYVCAVDVHSIMQAQRNTAHMQALRNAHMVLPDGTPLVWVAHARGERTMRRVCGPDIMLHLCGLGVGKGWRHYFYGGGEGVAEELASRLQSMFPGLAVAGTQSPPFRELSPAERDASIRAIDEARPDVVWIGLGCPKQEIWMRENADRLRGAVAIGVGAAFDFHSNRIARAPAWMRGSGLEWLHRLGSEPRRLWRRYLLLGPEFLARAALETVRMRRTAARQAAERTGG